MERGVLLRKGVGVGMERTAVRFSEHEEGSVRLDVDRSAAEGSGKGGRTACCGLLQIKGMELDS